VRFRTATAAEAEEVVDLIESAYRGESSRGGWTTEADLLDGQRTDIEAVREALASDQVRLLLAVSGAGEILGCCQLERRGPDTAYFGSFAVRPGLQSKGLGRQLLAEAERRARLDWGAETMEMAVIAQRVELIGWYERRGYSLTGETRPFPYADERAGLPRRPDLHFVVMTKALSG
jgi:ribosomal protein S18 acetylase RimI-like enzyme